MSSILQSDQWINNRPWIDQQDADIRQYVASLVSRPDYDLEEKLTSWRDDGLVIFEGAVPQLLIDDYLEDLYHFINNYNAYDVPIEIRGEQLSSRALESFAADMTGVKLNQMHCFSRAAAQMSLVPNVTDFLGHVFGGPASVCQSLTFWRGSEQPIHIDYPYVRQQTKLGYLAASWVPLEDIHPDSGPLAYYPGGHLVDRSGFFDWGEGSILFDEHSSRTPTDFAAFLSAQMESADIRGRSFCPKRGDVLIWHGNLPHEGTPVRDVNLTRKSYVTHYTAEAALPDWMRNFDADGNAIGVFENGGFSYRYRWFNDATPFPSWR